MQVRPPTLDSRETGSGTTHFRQSRDWKKEGISVVGQQHAPPTKIKGDVGMAKYFSKKCGNKG